LGVRITSPGAGDDPIVLRKAFVRHIFSIHNTIQRRFAKRKSGYLCRRRRRRGYIYMGKKGKKENSLKDEEQSQAISTMTIW